MSFLTDIETAVTSGFTAVATSYGATLLGAFRPVFIIGFSIWILLISYETAFGKSEDGMTYILSKIFRIFLIGTLALYGWPEVSDLLIGIKEGFVPTGTVSAALEASFITPMTNIYDALYTWAGNVISSSATGFAIFNVVKLMMVLIFVIILFLAFAVFAIMIGLIGALTLAMFLVANSVFILLLAVGPFFLLCLAFPFTQRFFETYIGSVMTAILAMGFTYLMISFVASLFGFASTGALFPPALDSDSAIANIKSVAVYFCAQSAKTLLIIYMYYKVFDLAAALGGGLNIGNNMIGAIRTIARDAVSRDSGSKSANPSVVNQINQGTSGKSAGVSASRGSFAEAVNKNQSLTGMGISAGAYVAGSASRGVYQTARAVGRTATASGRYAYNRFSQMRGRNSMSV
jgi:type IV secretion system protein VirB6